MSARENDAVWGDANCSARLFLREDEGCGDRVGVQVAALEVLGQSDGVVLQPIAFALERAVEGGWVTEDPWEGGKVGRGKLWW